MLYLPNPANFYIGTNTSESNSQNSNSCMLSDQSMITRRGDARLVAHRSVYFQLTCVQRTMNPTVANNWIQTSNLALVKQYHFLSSLLDAVEVGRLLVSYWQNIDIEIRLIFLYLAKYTTNKGTPLVQINFLGINQSGTVKYLFAHLSFVQLLFGQLLLFN